MIRYDLIPAMGLEEVHKVLNSKLENHEINEWRKGLHWSEVLSILEKHLLEFKTGNDFDKDNLLHIAHVASQALLLCEMYKCFPQGDDRVIQTNEPIICCDLDDCVFGFTEAYEKRFNVKLSDYWSGDYNMASNLDELKSDKDFWVNMPVKTTIPFEVDYYVTARSIPIEWTQEAIQKNNLPKAKIYSLKWNESKIDTLKSLNCSIMIDDKYQTFKECKKNGIFCYLITSSANARYNVGHHRINSISDLKFLK